MFIIMRFPFSPCFLLDVERHRTAPPAEGVGLVAALTKRAGTFRLQSFNDNNKLTSYQHIKTAFMILSKLSVKNDVRRPLNKF